MTDLRHPHVPVTCRELVRIADEAGQGCPDPARLKLHATAESATSAAAGSFHCDGVRCLVMQAWISSKRFRITYVKAMWRLFPALEYEVFIADVIT